MAYSHYISLLLPSKLGKISLIAFVWQVCECGATRGYQSSSPLTAASERTFGMKKIDTISFFFFLFFFPFFLLLEMAFLEIIVYSFRNVPLPHTMRVSRIQQLRRGHAESIRAAGGPRQARDTILSQGRARTQSWSGWSGLRRPCGVGRT